RGSSSAHAAPLANVDEVARDRRRRRHLRADQMSAATAPLASLEVPVRGRSAALARLQDVRVHAEAHRAARLAPLEAGAAEHLVQSLALGLLLHLLRARDDHRT